MSKQHPLDPDAQRLLDEVVDLVLPEVEEKGRSGRGAVAARAGADLILDGWSKGRSGASNLIRTLAAEGLRARITAAAHASAGRLQINWEGRQITAPSRIGVATDGGGFQQRLFYDVTPDQFLAYVDRLRANRDTLAADIALYSRIVDLITPYRAEPTVGDALRRAGVDPASFRKAA